MLSDFEGKISAALGVPSGKGSTLTFEIDGKKVDFERGVTTKRWTVIVKDGKVIEPPPRRMSRRHSVGFQPESTKVVEFDMYDEEIREVFWYSRDEYDILKARNR